MAFLDFDDALNEVGDLQFTPLMRYKIYNILCYRFAEYPALWIDLTLMLEQQAVPAVRSAALLDHLRDFACDMESVQLEYHLVQGQLTLTILGG